MSVSNSIHTCLFDSAGTFNPCLGNGRACPTPYVPCLALTAGKACKSKNPACQGIALSYKARRVDGYWLSDLGIWGPQQPCLDFQNIAREALRNPNPQGKTAERKPAEANAGPAAGSDLASAPSDTLLAGGLQRAWVV